MRVPKKSGRGRKRKMRKNTTAISNLSMDYLDMEDTDSIDFEEIDHNERLLSRLGF